MKIDKNQVYETIKSMNFETYRNSRVIDEVGGVEFTVEDAIKAAIITGTNIFLLSRSGAGKTRMEFDILYGMFGGKGVWARGGLNPNVESLYKVLDLEALRTAKTTKDVVKLTSNVNYKVAIMDELNNSPGPVQQQFFNICEGYIEHDGKRYKLGNGDYTIGIGSGNPKNGEYTHVFDLTRAIIDRMPLILDLDHWYKTFEDGWDVLMTIDNPKIKEAEINDLSEDIISVYNHLQEQPAAVERVIGALYMEYGLDYCSQIEGNSKRDNHTHRIIECDEKGGLCGYLNPMTTRQAIALKNYSKGIEAVSRAKGGNPSALETFLTAVKVAGPHSGILKPEYVFREHGGSNCKAINPFYEFLKREFEDKKKEIVNAISEAKAGALSNATIEIFEGEWGFMIPMLKRLNEKRRKNLM